MEKAKHSSTFLLLVTIATTHIKCMSVKNHLLGKNSLGRFAFGNNQWPSGVPSRAGRQNEMVDILGDQKYDRNWTAPRTNSIHSRVKKCVVFNANFVHMYLVHCFMSQPSGCETQCRKA